MMLVPLLRVLDRVQGDPTVAWSGSRLAVGARRGRGARREPRGGAARAVALGRRGDRDRTDRRGGAAAVSAGHAPRGGACPRPCSCGRSSRARSSAARSTCPYLLIDRYEFSPSLAGAVLTGAGISWAAASWLQGRLGDRISNTDVVRIGTALLALSLVAVLAVAAFTLHPAVAFVAWTLSGAAMGFMYAHVSRYRSSSSRGRRPGVQQRRAHDRRVAGRRGRARDHGHQ